MTEAAVDGYTRSYGDLTWNDTDKVWEITVTNTLDRNMLKIYKAFTFNGMPVDVNSLSDEAKDALMEYQKTSPPVAYTTGVLRNQAAKGIINTMVMERQAYINTPELKSYVASGKLTQEQADLILNYYKEQEALRNGTCPNCGYQFQNGFGKGGHGMGGRGMKGGKGGRMFGGMNMPGQQPSTQSGTDSQASGTAFEFGAQTIPFMDGTEGI